MVRKLVLAVAAASALMSSNMIMALGVGNINLRSALNQPLDAEIELLQVRDLSSNEILPTLASPDDFGRAGIDRAFFLTDLQFTPEVRPDGRAVIRVTSTQPVREPFLNFLLDVRWPSGRVLREFTVLLDPPLYQPGPVTAVAAPSTPAAASSASRPMPSAAPVAPPSRAPAAASAARAPASQPSAAASGQLRTSPADTLWEIAQRNRPQGASVHQTMLAIQDLNPGAFINGNINQMRANQTLNLPDAAQASRRSQAEAIAQVAEQNAAWRTGRQAAEAAPAQRQLDARERQTAAPAPATAPAADSLRLVAGVDEEGGAGDRAGAGRERQLQDALDRTKEQLDSAVSENAEMSERLQDVQAQLETLQRLLALKDTQLAALQQQLAATDEAPAASAPVDDLAALDAAQQDEPIEPVLDQPSDVTATPGEQSPEVVGSVAETEASPAEPSADVTPPADTAEPAPVAPAPVVAEEDGIERTLQGFLQNQTLLLAVGGAALLVLLLLLMALARRNARREEEYSAGLMPTSPTRDTRTNEGEFNLALASFDETQDEPLAADVLTEADALIAYGKLSEAAEILSEAINAEPDREDYRLKLMEVKALQQDQRGYVEQAERLQEMGVADTQVAALNARFPTMAAGLLGASVINDMDEGFDIDFDLAAEDEAKTAVAAEPAMDFDFSEFEAELAVDDTLATTPQEPQPAEAVESGQEFDAADAVEDFDLDFDLDDDLAEELSQPENPAEASIVGEAEFDLNLDELEEQGLAQPAAPDVNEELSLDEDFDLSLTDDLQADQLLAELEADSAVVTIDEQVEPAAAEPPPEEPVSLDADELTETEGGELPELSDEDLASFEAELSASIASEAAGEPEVMSDNGLPDALDPFADDRPTSEAIGDSMDDEFDFLSGTDECATKLDLARAYIDMGDEEGARDILSEVVDEGTDQQKQDARDMLAQLS